MRALAWTLVGLLGISCATAEETPSLGSGGHGGASGSSDDAAGGAAGSTGEGGASGGGVGGVFGSGSGGALGSGGATGGSVGTGGATGGSVGTGGATGGSAGTSVGGTGASGGASGSTGASGSGGSAGTGGASGSGGTAGAAGTNGAAGTSGASGSGGASGTGGAAGTNGVAGTGGACGDADGDSLTDCDERDDSDPWTDPAIFNGMHVRLADQCSASGNCQENDTLNEVNQCMNPIHQELDQYSGWDWEDPPNDVCSSGYRFLPNWTNCRSTWAADWQGCIHLEGNGPHCFQITGGNGEGCAALYFNGNTGNADVQTGGAAKCFSVGTGNYPIRWHYTMDNGSSSSMHVRYCAGTGSNCTPSAAIPQRMLRTRCP